MKRRLVSGMQPDEQLHIGNYLGALKNWVKLQDEYDCFFFVADLHALTTDIKPIDYTKEVVKWYLAAGLDPKKCTIFVQSHLPEHSELAWIFNCLISVSELERMTQFKEKSKQYSPNAGLLTYPCLMAADILLYKAHGVPVGQDQVQHIEITRKIARKFNQKYDRLLPEPKAILSEVPRLMSLTNPKKKMSKSDSRGCLFLNDSSEQIKHKIQKAVTTSQGVENLHNLLKTFHGPKKRFKKYVELKKALCEAIIRELKPIQERKSALGEKNIDQILKEGAQQARKISAQTMEQVKQKIGLV